jgi:hypothetical protein
MLSDHDVICASIWLYSNIDSVMGNKGAGKVAF